MDTNGLFGRLLTMFVMDWKWRKIYLRSPIGFAIKGSLGLCDPSNLKVLIVKEPLLLTELV